MLTSIKHSLVSSFTILFCLLNMAWHNAHASTVDLPLPFDTIKAVNQPVDAWSNVPGLVLTVNKNGTTQNIFAPAIADTYLHGGKKTQQNGSGWFVSLIQDQP